jgi:lysozyme family protein
MSNAYADYKDGYTKLLHTYKIKKEWSKTIEARAKEIFDLRDHYKSVSQATGVPWPFIGVIHNLESGLSFSTHLHNGNPLTGRTYDEPKGYPRTGKPPFTWEYSAIDSLKI